MVFEADKLKKNIMDTTIIDKNKLKAKDKNEFLKLAYSINPEKFRRLIKLHHKDFEVENESRFDNLLNDEDFNFTLFLSQFSSNTKEIIRASKIGRIRGI